MRGREREKKIIVPFYSYPTWNRELNKKLQKIQKIKKHQDGFISSQNGSGEAEKERKKKSSFQSFTIRPGIKNSKKIEKIKKHHYVFISSQNGSGVAEKQ